MYCNNCGQPIQENSAFCSNCGASQRPATTHSSPQLTPQQPPQAVSYPSENNKPKTKKWYEKTIVIILLLIFFFPAGLFLMWKYTDWKKIIKIIITVIVAIFAIGMMFGDSESNTDTSAQTTETTVYTAETTSSTAAIDKDVYAFTSISNLTNEEAKAILKNLEAVGFDHIDSVVVNGSQSDADAGASFNVSYNGYTITLTVIDRKTDYMVSGDVVLFEDGKIVDNINNYIISDGEKGQFIYYAKEFVLQGLKAPSTAEFPGTVLEIGEWKVSRNKNVVTVRSYVDSQNSFGAMIRSNFAVQMNYTDKTCLYMEIDGTVMYGEPQ